MRTTVCERGKLNSEEREGMDGRLTAVSALLSSAFFSETHLEYNFKAEIQRTRFRRATERQMVC